MSESVGQQLRRARQERGLSLEQVAQGTRIRRHYLEAIESGRFDQLPSPVQARGFLRVYTSYLGLNPELLFRSLEGEPVAIPTAEPEAGVTQAKEPDPGSRDDQAIFKEVGQQLQRQRELLGLSLEDVERHTHLRIHYLQALESGNLGGLPSPVQGRGMLHNYASFLGIDPEPVLLHFAEGLQARLSARQAAQPRPRSARRPRVLSAPLRRLFSSDFLFGGFLILFLVGFVIWGAIRISAIRTAQGITPTVPSIAEALLLEEESTLTLTPTASLSPETPGPTGEQSPIVAEAVQAIGVDEGTTTPEVPLPTLGEGAVRMSLVVHQRAWVRVTVDGEVEFEGRVLPGSAYAFAGEEQVEILTGNGAALQVFFNQNDLGLMGVFGEVVERVFTSQGMVPPTPTNTSVPTATIPPTSTPMPEVMSAPTVTPLP